MLLFRLISLFVLAMMASNSVAQEVISIYPGKAPGSESWTWSERLLEVPNDSIIMDVSNPTLTAYLPKRPNGTAVIVAPGGAFTVLAIRSEGTEVAKYLSERGVAVFVLKYRLRHWDPARPETNPMRLIMSGNFKKLDSLNSPVVKLALEDALSAVKYVRSNASRYKVDPNKIGFMGFSAGATLTLCLAYNSSEDSQPNFIAPIYAYEPAIIGSTIPNYTLPIFIAAASNDELGMAPHSVSIYTKWLSAKQPVELHIFEKGGHGFGMRKQNLPTDKWIESFTVWLQMHKFLE